MSAKVAFWAPAGLASATIQSKEQALLELTRFFETNKEFHSIPWAEVTKPGNESVKKAIEFLFNDRRELKSEAAYVNLDPLKSLNRELGNFKLKFGGGTNSDPQEIVSRETIMRVNDPANLPIRNRLVAAPATPLIRELGGRADEIALTVAAAAVTEAPYVTAWKAKFAALKESPEYKANYNNRDIVYAGDDAVVYAEKELQQAKPNNTTLETSYLAVLHRIFNSALDAKYKKDFTVTSPITAGIAADFVYDSIDSISKITSLETLRTELGKISALPLQQQPKVGRDSLVAGLRLHQRLRDDGYDLSGVPVPPKNDKPLVREFIDALKSIESQGIRALEKAEDSARIAANTFLTTLSQQMVALSLAAPPKERLSKKTALLDILEKGFVHTTVPDSFTHVFELIAAARATFVKKRDETAADKSHIEAYKKLLSDAEAAQRALLGTLVAYQTKLSGELADVSVTLTLPGFQNRFGATHSKLSAEVKSITDQGTSLNLVDLGARVAQLSTDVGTALENQKREEADAARIAAATPVSAKVTAGKALEQLKIYYGSLSAEQQAGASFFKTRIALLEAQYKGAETDDVFNDVEIRSTEALGRLRAATQTVASRPINVNLTTISDPNNTAQVRFTLKSPTLFDDVVKKNAVYSFVIETPNGEYLAAISGPRSVQFAAALVSTEEGVYDVQVRLNGTNLVDAKSGVGQFVSVGAARKVASKTGAASWMISLNPGSPYVPYLQGTISGESIHSKLQKEDPVNRTSIDVTGSAASHTQVKSGQRVFADAKLVDK